MLEKYISPLQDIDGYLSSAIYDVAGKTLVTGDQTKFDIPLIGKYIIAIMNASGLGRTAYIYIETLKGDLSTVFVLEEAIIIGVLLEQDSNRGIAKIILHEAGEKIGSCLLNSAQ